MSAMKAALDEDLESAARVLQNAITDLIRVYQFRDRDTICCYDISLGQSHALERLGRAGPMSLNDFAASLFVEKSSASRLADALEKKGYVTRKPHPEDGRVVLLHLTKPGRLLAVRIDRDLLEERAHVLKDLSPGERQVVVESIAQLAAIATSSVKAGGGSCERL